MVPDEMMEKMAELIRESSYETINVSIRNRLAFGTTFRSILAKDKSLAFMAVALLVVYNMLFLGTCSPIHCRITVALSGMVCILLSIISGYGLGTWLGYEMNEAHEALPILMLGIGVDDMFVICNALDQTNLKWPTEKRLVESIKHAGASITITSLTDALAFLAGSSTSIPGIQSFCIYCSITVVMLYTCVMTVFLCVVYWDAIRISKKYGECCGAFRCKEDSTLFCKGVFLSVE